jgi:hypothetical protein
MDEDGKWQTLADGSVSIDHVTLREDDRVRLGGVGRLTVWNVKFSDGFLARLPDLWFLDLRGGSSADLSVIRGAVNLRGLVVNQIRGLVDASEISQLQNLEYLSLYGLARLESLPAFEQLTALRRIELGQLRRLTNWDPLVAAPALEELLFVNKVFPDDRTVARLAAHPRLRTFSWYAPDEPLRTVSRVVETMNRPPTATSFPEAWFAAQHEDDVP